MGWEDDFKGANTARKREREMRVGLINELASIIIIHVQLRTMMMMSRDDDDLAHLFEGRDRGQRRAGLTLSFEGGLIITERLDFGVCV